MTITIQTGFVSSMILIITILTGILLIIGDGVHTTTLLTAAGIHGIGILGDIAQWDGTTHGITIHGDIITLGIMAHITDTTHGIILIIAIIITDIIIIMTGTTATTKIIMKAAAVQETS